MQYTYYKIFYMIYWIHEDTTEYIITLLDFEFITKTNEQRNNRPLNKKTLQQPYPPWVPIWGFLLIFSGT